MPPGAPTAREFCTQNQLLPAFSQSACSRLMQAIAEIQRFSSLASPVPILSAIPFNHFCASPHFVLARGIFPCIPPHLTKLGAGFGVP